MKAGPSWAWTLALRLSGVSPASTATWIVLRARAARARVPLRLGVRLSREWMRPVQGPSEGSLVLGKSRLALHHDGAAIHLAAGAGRDEKPMKCKQDTPSITASCEEPHKGTVLETFEQDTASSWERLCVSSES